MRDLIVYGVGELGQLYASGALRAGLRVTPITRALDPTEVWSSTAPDVPLLISVGEAALEGVLRSLPAERKSAAILLQNELFPSQWRRHGMTPSVMVPWLLKKRGQPLLVGRPTALYGRSAPLLAELHGALGLPWETLSREPALHGAIIDKYAFIVCVNALGLASDLTLGAWLARDRQRVHALILEGARLGAALCTEATQSTDRSDPADTIPIVEQAMSAMASMQARGRSAGERVTRALAHAARLGVATPELAAICAQAKAC